MESFSRVALSLSFRGKLTPLGQTCTGWQNGREPSDEEDRHGRERAHRSWKIMDQGGKSTKCVFHVDGTLEMPLPALMKPIVGGEV